MVRYIESEDDAVRSFLSTETLLESYVRYGDSIVCSILVPYSGTRLLFCLFCLKGKKRKIKANYELQLDSLQLYVVLGRTFATSV